MKRWRPPVMACFFGLLGAVPAAAQRRVVKPADLVGTWAVVEEPAKYKEDHGVAQMVDFVIFRPDSVFTRRMADGDSTTLGFGYGLDFFTGFDGNGKGERRMVWLLDGDTLKVKGTSPDGDALEGVPMIVAIQGDTLFLDIQPTLPTSDRPRLPSRCTVYTRFDPAKPLPAPGTFGAEGPCTEHGKKQ